MSRLRNTRRGGRRRSCTFEMVWRICSLSTPASSSTKRAIRRLALASAGPVRLPLSHRSCSISAIEGVSRALSTGSLRTSRRSMRWIMSPSRVARPARSSSSPIGGRVASPPPPDGAPPPCEAPPPRLRSVPGGRPSAPSSHSTSRAQALYCWAVTAPCVLGPKELSSSLETTRARCTVPLRSVGAGSGGTGSPCSSGGAKPGSGRAKSGRSLGKRWTRASMVMRGSSSSAGTSVDLASWSARVSRFCAASPCSNRAESRRQYRPWRVRWLSSGGSWVVNASSVWGRVRAVSSSCAAACWRAP